MHFLIVLINRFNKTDLAVFFYCRYRETGLSPPVKYFTDHSKAMPLLWVGYAITVLFLIFILARLFIDTLWPHSPLISWVSSGA